MLRCKPATWLLLALLYASAAVAADCKLRQMEIPVRLVDGRPIATLTLDGTDVPMLLDSGAFFSFLSESTATQLKLPTRRLPDGMFVEGYTGRIAEARRTRVDKVLLSGAELSNIEFVVGGNELGAGIMGVLGRNVLSAADTEYDLAHGVVRLIFPGGDCGKTGLAYWAGDAPVVVVPLEDQGRGRGGATAIHVEVKVNGMRAMALLDTGAPQTLLSLRTARRAGIEERDLVPAGRVGGAGEGRAQSWTGPVALFELGGEKIANNRMQVDDVDSPDYGLVLGLDYFLAHRIYVSRLQQQVYVTWNGGPVFARSGDGAGAYDPRYAALPPAVSQDDADALARRGAAALAARSYQRALDDLNRACALAPGVADYFYTRARIQLALQRRPEALADLDTALGLDPALAEARLRRAAIRFAADDRGGTLTDLAQLDAALPPAAPLRVDMAELYAALDDAPGALRQYALWIDSHGNDVRLASALNGRCWLRARLNVELPLALQDCKDAVDRDGGAAAHRDSLGWTYLRLGDAGKAKRAFDDAIRLQTLAVSLYGRGLALLRLNDAAGGERDLAEARRLAPGIDDDLRRRGFDFVPAPPAPGS